MSAEVWLTQLHENGYRITKARGAVVETMELSNCALTPVEVYDMARKKYRALGLVTVYRTLEKRRAASHSACASANGMPGFHLGRRRTSAFIALSKLRTSRILRRRRPGCVDKVHCQKDGLPDQRTLAATLWSVRELPRKLKNTNSSLVILMGR